MDKKTLDKTEDMLILSNIHEENFHIEGKDNKC